MGLQLGHQNYKNMKRLHPSLDSEDVSPDLLASSQLTAGLDDAPRKRDTHPHLKEQLNRSAQLLGLLISILIHTYSFLSTILNI
jgi:hypothetical protein